MHKFVYGDNIWQNLEAQLRVQGTWEIKLATEYFSRAITQYLERKYREASYLSQHQYILLQIFRREKLAPSKWDAPYSQASRSKFATLKSKIWGVAVVPH